MQEDEDRFIQIAWPAQSVRNSDIKVAIRTPPIELPPGLPDLQCAVLGCKHKVPIRC
jgi:hypothetical protein